MRVSDNGRGLSCACYFGTSDVPVSLLQLWYVPLAIGLPRVTLLYLPPPVIPLYIPVP